MLEPASIDRPLNLRLRADLVSTRVEFSGAETWVVKDPLTLEHHQFTREEHFLLKQLAEPITWGQLRRRFETRFAPQRITHQAIWAFVTRAHQAGLLASSAHGQGAELLDRDRTDRLRQWGLAWTQVLAIRFRGVDPDRWLTTMHRTFGWLISWWTVALCAMIVAFAGTLVVGNWDEFLARLPQLAALADWRNLPWLMVALAVVKVLHELGHAVACKHYDGEVHELGLLLLAFTPCLYCDVSDAWQMPSRKKRIAISAAGILVELVLAAVASIVWWYSRPGVVNLLALNIVVICTVSTLLVNGNPLLRYDGYYILSDLTESPNLWQRSRQVFDEVFGRLVFGWQTRGDAITPSTHRVWLLAYALLSKLYLGFVLVSIVWMLVQVLAPLHLENLAYSVGTIALAGTLVAPVAAATRIARNPVRRRQVRPGRAAAVVIVACAAAVALVSLPVPYRVAAPLVLMPRDAEAIYATTEGTLLQALPPGARVSAGDVVARLESTDLVRSVALLEGQQRVQTLRIDNLAALRREDPGAAAQIPAAQAALAATETQLADRQRDAERLNLRAPIAGVVMSVPDVSPAANAAQLPTWSGNPLEPANRGATLSPGTHVCWIGQPQALEAVLLVDESEAQRIRIGQSVRLEIDALPWDVLRGEVIEIAQRPEAANADTPAAPFTKLSAGMLPPGRDYAPLRVRVEIHRSPDGLRIGNRGTGRISTDKMPLGLRILRWLAHTFRLPA